MPRRLLWPFLKFLVPAKAGTRWEPGRDCFPPVLQGAAWAQPRVSPAGTAPCPGQAQPRVSPARCPRARSRRQQRSRGQLPAFITPHRPQSAAWIWASFGISAERVRKHPGTYTDYCIFFPPQIMVTKQYAFILHQTRTQTLGGVFAAGQPLSRIPRESRALLQEPPAPLLRARDTHQRCTHQPGRTRPYLLLYSRAVLKPGWDYGSQTIHLIPAALIAGRRTGKCVNSEDLRRSAPTELFSPFSPFLFFVFVSPAPAALPPCRRSYLRPVSSPRLPRRKMAAPAQRRPARPR